MKYADLINDVIVSINEITCDLTTKQYRQFLELLRDDLDERIDTLDEEVVNDDDELDNDYEYSEDDE